MMRGLENIVAAQSRLEKRSFHFGAEDTLYPAEMNLLEMIKDREVATATALCQQLGVTKGAISQLVSKLAGKGYLHKSRHAGNAKEIRLSLSAKGEKATEVLAAYQQRIDQDLLACLSAYSEAQLADFASMLETLAITIEDYAQQGIELAD